MSIHIGCLLVHLACPQECSNFLAGNMLRSASRYHALDETGLFGCVCCHEHPVLFMDLKHGEKSVLQCLTGVRVCSFSLYRLAYAVYMIDALMERHKRADLYVTYDIACTLQRHLRVSCIQ